MSPYGITAGPDGNVWFTSANNRIGRITPAGTITTFTDPAGNIDAPFGITTGPDGNLWFSNRGNARIGRITPAGTITTFVDPSGAVSLPSTVTAGPDGNVWFTSGGTARVGRITPAGTITTFDVSPVMGHGALGIAAGSDGALWFTASVTNRIGRITTAGVASSFPDPAGNIDLPTRIVSGPNRRLWFVSSNNNRIGTIEPATVCSDAPPPNGFADVPAGAWYGGALDWAKCHGIVAGFPGNVYRPNDPVNRAQAASILWAFVDEPIGAPPHGFSDVSPSAWFARALDWVKANGVVNGFPGNVYRPNDPVNRAQIVAWMWELAGQPSGIPHGFSDVSPSAWFSPALDWAKVKGLVSGFPGNLYRPNDPVSRAQIVDMLSDFASTESAWTNWPGPELYTWRH